MMKNNVILVIPIYKSKLLKEEEASLKQCFRILGNYSVKFVCPPDIDITIYKKYADVNDNDVEFVKFDADYFRDIAGYNRLMLSLDFYLRFKNYRYMLIYQLDAWVFRDELEYWCSLGYDYIGAPWFEGFSEAKEDSEIYKVAGNGGFSLRHIPSFINILSRIKKKQYSNRRIKSLAEINAKLNLPLYKKYKVLFKFFSRKNSLLFYLNNYYEDIIIVSCFKKIDKSFKLADYQIGLKFSFEVNPSVLYKMNNNMLPFGCHAFNRYDSTFWQKFIDIK